MNLPNFSSICELDTKYLEEKFAIVVVFGSSLAAISFVENVLVFFILLLNRQFFYSNLFFNLTIAFLDILIAVCYILLFSIEILSDKLHRFDLHVMWHSYLRPVFTAGHVSLTASAYTIISATFERFLTTIRPGTPPFSQRRRYVAVALPILAALIFKGTVLYEVTTGENPNCTGTLTMWKADLNSQIKHNNVYRAGWMFYTRNIATVVLPFAVLSAMNTIIVYSMNKQAHKLDDRNSENNSLCEQDALLAANVKANARTATKTMICIVTTWLIANALSVVYTIWEFLAIEQLEQMKTFHSLARDFINVLSVFAGLVRLPIYLWCNVQFRKKVKDCMCTVLPFMKKGQQEMVIESELIERQPLTAHNGVKQRDKCETVVSVKI